MDLFVEILFDEMNLIEEGSQSLWRMKSEEEIVETEQIRPSVTMIRGQKSSEISQRTRENSNWRIRIGAFA
jgi:hypothetical protein